MCELTVMSRLQTTLQKSGLIDEASSFEGFFAGFNQANRRFLMVDVGYGKEMADARMRCAYFSFISFVFSMNENHSISRGLLPYSKYLEDHLWRMSR